jgi:hypothetical protein
MQSSTNGKSYLLLVLVSLCGQVFRPDDLNLLFERNVFEQSINLLFRDYREFF